MTPQELDGYTTRTVVLSGLAALALGVLVACSTTASFPMPTAADLAHQKRRVLLTAEKAKAPILAGLYGTQDDLAQLDADAQEEVHDLEVWARANGVATTAPVDTIAAITTSFPGPVPAGVPR